VKGTGVRYPQGDGRTRGAGANQIGDRGRAAHLAPSRPTAGVAEVERCSVSAAARSVRRLDRRTAAFTLRYQLRVVYILRIIRRNPSTMSTFPCGTADFGQFGAVHSIIGASPG